VAWRADFSFEAVARLMRISQLQDKWPRGQVRNKEYLMPSGVKPVQSFLPLGFLKGASLAVLSPDLLIVDAAVPTFANGGKE
jgi:hypothetical protein